MSDLHPWLQMAVAAAQIAAPFGILAALILAGWSLRTANYSLRLSRSRMRLETRPVIRVDLTCLDAGIGADDPNLVLGAPEGFDNRGPTVGYTVSNLQAASTGFALYLEVRFKVELDGEASPVTPTASIPIVEPATEKPWTPLVIVGVYKRPDSWRTGRVSVEEGSYQDVDGNEYDLIVGGVVLEISGDGDKTLYGAIGSAGPHS